MLGDVMDGDDADALLAAAYLHDVGYAPELAETGFHAVDGARFVRSAGHDRVAGLVAYHSGAKTEAAERLLENELSEFEDEDSVVSRALTYCDLTTDAEGRAVEPADRLADIRERYGSAAPESRAVERLGQALLDDVVAIETMLAKSGIDGLGGLSERMRTR
jgi:HD superfamily phosphodiesterase